MSRLWVYVWLLWVGEGFAAGALVRGPYLQSGSPNSVIVRWRTDESSGSVVRYGTNLASLSSSALDPTFTTEHEVELSALTPDTRYYYSVGTATAVLASGPTFFFVTAPAEAKPTRIWVLGDSGTANFEAAAVRDAYQTFAGSRHTDLWLMLGDNAYESGFDDEFQHAVFEMYPEMLRKSVLWPTIGNHDAPYAPFEHFPYLDIFTLPTQGEAGGIASGTERYCSFDYGNIHFVCLDSMTVSRGSNGPMCNWLRADLEANEKDWLIAFWHHPPYSRGSHNSDFELELVEMRQNVVPILEQFGVDLVLAGHSHSYERSYLLDGHYGRSETLEPHMIKDSSGGRPCESGGYFKPLGASRSGAVYTVAGSSGQVNGSALHPAMFMHLSTLGSLVLDIDGDLMVARFLDSTGRIADEFSVSKGLSRVPCPDPDAGSVPDIVWKTNAHNAPVRRVAFAPGGSTLASAAEDGKIKLWAVNDGAPLNEWRADQGFTDQVLFLPDATHLVSSGTDGQIKFWQTPEGMLDRALEANFSFQAELPIAYSAPANVLASGASVWNPFGYFMPGFINLWRASDGALLRTLAARHGWGMDFSPDGTVLASASVDGTLRRWRVPDGIELPPLPTGVTDAVKYSPDGTLIATGGADRNVYLWNAASGALVRTLVGHNDAISALAFSPDGVTLATAGQFDITLRFWRVSDGQLLRTFHRECYAINSIAFSADGHLFAYGRADKVVVVARNPFPPSGLTISEGAALEGHAMQFAARLDAPSGQIVSANFETLNGSGLAGVDFVHTNGVISFAPGETNKMITIATIADSYRETNEFFRIALSNPVNSTINVGQSTGVIFNDDPLPIIWADGGVVDESAGVMVFYVWLSERSHQTITLDYFTDNETAFALEDYGPAIGALTFEPGEMVKAIAVDIADDTLSESPEAVELWFMNPRNAILEFPGAFGWIIDNDSTAGQLSHFEWNSIGASQLVNRPFHVALRARDGQGDLVTSFSGTADLTGMKPPAVLFADDFEDGSISDWASRAAPYVRAVTNDTAARGARSLTLIGGGRYRLDGVAHTLGGIQPARINFHVRSASATKSGAYMIAATNDTLQGSAVCFKMDGTNGMGLEEGGRFHGIPYVAHRWYKVSLLLDWARQRIVYYVDDQLVEQNIPFCTPAVRPLNVVHLYNFDPIQSWWDDIEFLQEAGGTPIAISPTITSQFVNGVWTGELTVLQPATSMRLLAQADARAGMSDDFSAFAFRPVIIQPPLSQVAVAGGDVTFSALASGTLPLQYEWRKAQPPLFTNLAVLHDTLSFWRLTNVQPSWAGNYFLTIRNVAGVAAAPFLLTVLADTDGDGLPDGWESAYNVGDIVGDPDADGMSNLAEYQAGTVPTNAASALRLSASIADGELHLSFEASSNKTYSIQQTLALAATNWLKLFDLPARGTNYVHRTTNALGEGFFYRVVTPVP